MEPMIHPCTDFDKSIQFVHHLKEKKMISWKEYMRTLHQIADEARRKEQAWEIKEHGYMARTID